MVNTTIFGNVGGVIPPPPTNVLNPLDPRIEYTDYFSIVEHDELHIRFGRPDYANDSTNGTRWVNPGARIRTRTNTTLLAANFYSNNFYTRTGLSRNYVGSVLVDGTEVSTFVTNGSDTFPYTSTVLVALDGSLHNVEFLLPQGDAVDFLGFSGDTGATFALPTNPRPASMLFAQGDSLTQGFECTKFTSSWVYLASLARNRSYINNGWGGRAAAPNSDDLSVAAFPNIADLIYMMGTNDLIQQNSLVDFQASVRANLIAGRAAMSSAGSTGKIHCCSLLYTPNSYGSITAAQYRSATQAAVNSIVDPLLVYHDGLTLVPNTPTYFASDGIHLNDAGEGQMAISVAAF